MNRKRMLGIVLALVLIVIVIIYLVPVPSKSFEELYRQVDPQVASSLQAFRRDTPLKTITVDGVAWSYISTGKGDKTILFLHGMTGAYDIWWQQINALKDRYRIIAVTYPAVDSLEGMNRAVLAILNREQVAQVSVVGTSLGGYFAQYFVAKNPQLVKRASFGNTFPPNDLIAEKNRTIGTLLPFLPEWFVMQTLRQSGVDSIYPAANKNELVLAFLTEQTYGGMGKSQVVARYRCVVERFIAPDVQALRIPVMIIEADNDPLVEDALRTQLKATYPTATVHTLHNVGHFSYLNESQTYMRILEEFLSK